MGKKNAAAKARAKAKREAKLRAKAEAAGLAGKVMVEEVNENGAVRPTPQQQQRGSYALPEGKDKAERPAVNTRPDRIAVLREHLDGIQHDAARDWQALRADVQAEIGTRGYRSCLDMSIAGHDETDGNAPLMAHWRMVNRVLGPRRCALLDRVCLDGMKPVDLDEFRSALDAFAVVQGRC